MFKNTLHYISTRRSNASPEAFVDTVATLRTQTHFDGRGVSVFCLDFLDGIGVFIEDDGSEGELGVPKK